MRYKRYERLFSCLLYLSGFVRYTRKPKAEQILILLSTAFGMETTTDKIKIIKGLRWRFFEWFSQKILPVP